MKFRGVFHVHSSHSYDGKVPLPALCQELRSRGYQFALFTEHDDTLDATAYGQIVRECQSLSDDRFLAVPGIEVRCWRTEQEQWHIAAIGVNDWIPRGPIPQVAARIRASGGLAILLHPHKYSARIAAADLEGFDGIEMWNGKEDGRVSPRGKTIHLARQAARRFGIPMYCGLDLHDLDRFPQLAIEVQAERFDAAAILDGLRGGAFELDANGLRFGSRNGPSATQRARFAILRGAFLAYSRTRQIPLIGQVFARMVARYR